MMAQYATVVAIIRFLAVLMKEGRSLHEGSGVQ